MDYSPDLKQNKSFIKIENRKFIVRREIFSFSVLIVRYFIKLVVGKLFELYGQKVNRSIFWTRWILNNHRVSRYTSSIFVVKRYAYCIYLTNCATLLIILVNHRYISSSKKLTSTSIFPFNPSSFFFHALFAHSHFLLRTIFVPSPSLQCRKKSND